jgi:VWFA-related protein
VSSEPVKMQMNVPPEGLIHLDVAATDHEGKPFSGLAAKDFTLMDNGAPQKMISFAASGQPENQDERLTEVVLVLDELNLSPSQLELVEKESIKFLRQNGGHLGQPASIYRLTTSGLYASAKPTTDGNALAEDVAHHRSPRTVLEIPRHDLFVTPESRWDRSLRAVYSIAVERRGNPGRKLLVWIGFGWPPIRGGAEPKDTAFSLLVELSTRIREARMVISEVTARSEPLAFDFKNTYKDYLAGARTPAEMEKAHFALPVLAIQSGGLVLDELSEISRSIKHCVEDAQVFYTMSFDPPIATRPDEYHDLKVQIATPELSARTNTGYYDEPVFYDQPRLPARNVTVHELELILDTSKAEQDGELAKQLAGLELSERLNSSLLSLWKTRLRGKKSVAALVALADEAAFQDPPASEILPDPAPDLETQNQMISRTVKYLAEVTPRLPDFFAIRTTIEYDQASPQNADNWKTALVDKSLREAATERATLRYRNGHEEQDLENKKRSSSARKMDLNFIGVFSPILASVLVDATRGNSILIFNHWEKGERGKEAVFHYLVRAEDPHYEVRYCCLVGGRTFLATPKYLGELAIDPATGAILRLTMEAELGWIHEPNLTPVQPAKASAMMVEYGPVEIGGKKYICPQRSVVVMRIRGVSTLAIWGQTFGVYAPYETMLNDIVYTDYHKFGSEARMLPGYDVVPGATASPAVNGQSSPKPPSDR